MEGTLDAVGTASEPITFTSVNDDTIGGATGSEFPAAGDWDGIAAEGSGATLDIEHATIAYAQEAVQTMYSGGVTLNDDQLNVDQLGLGSPNAGAGSPITVTNSSIDGGIDVQCPASFTATGNTVTGGPGIENYCDAVGSAVGSVIDIANNHVTIPTGDGGSPAISVAASNLNFTALASNTITAPQESDVVAVDGEVNVSEGMPATPFAWEIDGYATIDVPSGVTLTVKPGVVIKSSGGSGCEPYHCFCGSYDCSILVEGSLVATGTESAPITFTSINDNAIGGATGTGAPEPGEWQGIAAIGADATLDIEHATVAYAAAAVQTQDSGAVTLNDDRISGGVSSPNVGAGSPITLTNSSIEGGVDVNCAVSLTVTGNTITGGPGIQNDCDAIGSSVGSMVDIANNHVTVPGDDEDPAISVAAANLNFTRLASNTIAAPSASEAIAVDGEVNVSQAMPATSFAWEIAGYATVDVPGGVTLTVEPGAVIKSSTGGGPVCGSYECSISVEGTLDAVGTEAEPITFTSINDNAIGGTTGSGTPARGEWAGIEVGGSGALDIANASISYASTAIASTSDAKLKIGSTATPNLTRFVDNGTALDIAATPGFPGTNAAIHGNWFDGNGAALDGSSDWDPGDLSPFAPCQYIPSMSATGNTYGIAQSSKPYLSPSDYDELTAALVASLGEESPDGWTGDITKGTSDATTTDTITWADLPCTDGTIEGTELEPATPFAIGE